MFEQRTTGKRTFLALTLCCDPFKLEAKRLVSVNQTVRRLKGSGRTTGYQMLPFCRDLFEPGVKELVFAGLEYVVPGCSVRAEFRDGRDRLVYPDSARSEIA